MSVQTLINTFGIDFEIRRPTYTTAADGTVVRSYAKSYQARGFLSPSSQSEALAQGRQNSRRSGTIYLSGIYSVTTDDEIALDGVYLSYPLWRVVGSVNPLELQRTGVSKLLNFTAVSVVEVDPAEVAE